MSKRMRIDETFAPCKKAKRGRDGPDSEHIDVHTAASQSPSRATPPLLRKRKATDNLDDPDDPRISQTEEPKSKRSKTDDDASNSTRCSIDTPWEFIHYDEKFAKELKESIRSNVLWQVHVRTNILMDIDADDIPQPTIRNPLLSPDPSDRSDTDDYGATYTTSLRSPTPTFQEELSPTLQEPLPPTKTLPRRKTRTSLQSRRRRNEAPPQVQQSRRQPRKKKNTRHHQDRSPMSEGILIESRCSRRTPECKLWYLDDNGTACRVVSMK
ncbi:hypothetical protein ACHAQJ_002159 [Trichoderma viride]